MECLKIVFCLLLAIGLTYPIYRVLSASLAAKNAAMSYCVNMVLELPAPPNPRATPEEQRAWQTKWDAYVRKYPLK